MSARRNPAGDLCPKEIIARPPTNLVAFRPNIPKAVQFNLAIVDKGRNKLHAADPTMKARVQVANSLDALHLVDAGLNLWTRRNIAARPITQIGDGLGVPLGRLLVKNGIHANGRLL